MASKLEEKLLQYEKSFPISNDEELKEAVIKIIESEESLEYEERDYDLLDEATNLLLSLDHIDIGKLNEHTDKIFAEAMNELKNKEQKKVKRSTSVRIRWIVPIAAAMSILLLSCVVASAFGFSFADITKEIYTELKNGVQYIFGLDRVTVTNNVERFETIEELSKKEKFAELILPRNLGPDYTVKDILVLYYGDYESITINIEKQDNNIRFLIKTKYEGEYPDNKTKIGNIDVYVTQYNDIYQGEFVYDGCTYIVKSPSYEELTNVINILEE